MSHIIYVQVNDEEGEVKYNTTLRSLLDDHSDVVTLLAEGFAECRRHIKVWTLHNSVIKLLYPFCSSLSILSLKWMQKVITTSQALVIEPYLLDLLVLSLSIYAYMSSWICFWLIGILSLCLG